MLSGFKPVTLPVTDDEVAMVTRRQKALTAEINKIASMVRSGAYSSAEGRDRSAFLRGEIANLEQYKRARRTTGTTSWQPAPRPTPRADKPANKYVAPPRAEPPRTTPPQGKIDTGKAAPVHPMQNPYGKKYFGPSGNPGTNEITYGMKKDTAGFFYRYEETIGNNYSKRKVFTWYGPNSSDKQTKDNWGQWNQMHLKKFYTHSFTVSKPAPPPVTPTSTAKPTVKDNPYGKNYGPYNYGKMYADAVRNLAGGARPIKDGRYWYGPKTPNYRKSWEAWNNKYVYGTIAPKSATTAPTPAAKPHSKNVTNNPYSYDYGTKFPKKDSLLTKNNKIKHNGRYYGPKPKKTTFKFGGKEYTNYKSDTGMIAAWKKWNIDNNIKEVGSLFGLGAFKPHQRQSMNDRSFDTGEEGRARMHREVALREESNRIFQIKRQEELAIKAAAEELAREKAKENELRLKQQHRTPPQRGRQPIRRGSRIAPARMPPTQIIREETMMRKRAGATLTFDRPVPKGRPQSWEQEATKQEKDFVKLALAMVGLPESPKLSEKGNQLMIKALRIQRIENPQQKEKEMINYFNRTITELVNNSGYFAVKYRVEASAKGNIKLTEMAGIAGGFTKTRNSMQGLLRK